MRKSFGEWCWSCNNDVPYLVASLEKKFQPQAQKSYAKCIDCLWEFITKHLNTKNIKGDFEQAHRLRSELLTLLFWCDYDKTIKPSNHEE